jgi:hypothetical protein
VIDPESMLDGVRDVAIDGRWVSAVTEEHLEGLCVVDVSGLVVAPGFIDLHSHAQALAGRRLQAFDGVTAALDLEAGRAPVREAYAREVAAGSPIHYGFSTSWAAVRGWVLTGVVPDGGIESGLSVLGGTAWRGPLTREQRARALGHLADDLAQGAVGIGLLLGYAPDVDPDEYLAVARLAAGSGVPTFTHCRDLVELSPHATVDGAEELVRAAARTGAHMHACHVNSTSGRHIDRVLGLIERCQAEGGRVTTEAYPYGASATAIGAPFLGPERRDAPCRSCRCQAISTPCSGPWHQVRSPTHGRRAVSRGRCGCGGRRARRWPKLFAGARSSRPRCSRAAAPPCAPRAGCDRGPPPTLWSSTPSGLPTGRLMPTAHAHRPASGT